MIYLAPADGLLMLTSPVLVNAQGTAARWARERLESDHYVKQGRLQRINISKQDPSKAMQACTKIISATGFMRSRLPDNPHGWRPHAGHGYPARQSHRGHHS